MSVLAIVAALMLEQWRPLGDRKAVRRGCWRAGPTGSSTRSTPAKRATAPSPGWWRSLPVAAWRSRSITLLLWVSPLLALLFNVGCAVPDARLSPVQPLLHRPPARDPRRRRGPRARAARRLARRAGAAPQPRGGDPARDRGGAASPRTGTCSACCSGSCCCPARAARSCIASRCYLRRRWERPGRFRRASPRARVRVLEWPAVRLTAASFARGGRFRGRGLLLAHAGAQLARSGRGRGARRRRRRDGRAAGHAAHRDRRRRGCARELGLGESADSPFLDSTVGLVWRALVLWVFVLLVLGLAQALLGAGCRSASMRELRLELSRRRRRRSRPRPRPARPRAAAARRAAHRRPPAPRPRPGTPPAAVRPSRRRASRSSLRRGCPAASSRLRA